MIFSELENLFDVLGWETKRVELHETIMCVFQKKLIEPIRVHHNLFYNSIRIKVLHYPPYYQKALIYELRGNNSRLGKKLSFEEVFDYITEKDKEVLIYNLDLFSQGV